MKKTLLYMFCALILCPAAAHAQQKEMSVGEAYKAIPHQRTQYDLKQSPLPQDTRKFLDHLFFVTDIALQKRMMMLLYFNRGQESFYLKTYDTEIGNLIGSFSLIETHDPAAQKIRDTIILALQQQRQFFDEWAQAKGTPKYDRIKNGGLVNQILVQSAHQNLVRAYMMLKQAYPGETGHNQQAFYDHLCALDFL